MTRYVITGTPDLSPDCTVEDTGVAAGTHEGEPYWTWEAGGKTWYLFFRLGSPNRWAISDSLGGIPGHEWRGPTDTPIGEYDVIVGVTGTVTVAEHVAPDEYLVIEWTASGKFTVLTK